MVDINKIKARLDAAAKSAKDRESFKKDKVELFFKPQEIGEYKFRAVPYPHSNDPESEPFCERYYHFNIPGQYAVYCPNKNNGEKCELCDVVWENMKSFKGNKGALAPWRERLPQLWIMVAGKALDSDGNEIKTPAKFMKFRSDLDKMSENHKKLYKNFSSDPTWMNWDETGFNLEMEYAAPSDEQKKGGQFSNVTSMLTKAGITLARKPSAGFKSIDEYNKFVAELPDLDQTSPFAKKTSADIKPILEKWAEIADKKAGGPVVDTKTVGMKVEAEEVPDVQVEEEVVVAKKDEPVVTTAKPKEVKLSKLQQKLADMGVK